jgi:hypothetical protein
MSECAKWTSLQTVGRWQRRQSVGPVCGAEWQLLHDLVGALKFRSGWHKEQERLACSPDKLGNPGWEICFAGANAAVVWHVSQCVWPPCLVPWQFVQCFGEPIARLYRFPGWHFLHAIEACRPVSRHTLLCLNVERLNDEVVWQEAHLVRPPCFRPWHETHERPPITRANALFGWHAEQRRCAWAPERTNTLLWRNVDGENPLVV